MTTDTCAGLMYLEGNISLKQSAHITELWKCCVSYLLERNVLISNKQTFLYLKAIALCGHCSDRADYHSSFLHQRAPKGCAAILESRDGITGFCGASSTYIHRDPTCNSLPT